ncbi:efflux RND transporter permease subunit [Rhodohalobacter sulfatireducens]|uniref:MMPL family transporter n=1 Tax=Rhodohalobacter sulfatireducens TaxID=2911366 RepID=A0ABS9K904_9BACT|nr:MMPL family transporter [Rhodohalobacter sulfatireducens]MCG2587331.1 MMPL family transporter [Rhodohalobacter sulfatireducens]
MFKKLFQRLRPALSFTKKHAGLVVIGSFILSLIGLGLARQLSIDSDFSKLIPESYPSVQALEKLKEQVGTINEVAVVIESNSFATNKEFAERLIPEAMNLRNRLDGEPYFNRVEYRKEISFLEQNALYFATDEELTTLEQFLDDKIEEARLEANPFYFDLDGDESENSADSLGQVLEDTYNDLIGDEYLISPDSLTMALKFFPAGSQTDIQYIEELYSDLESLTDSLAAAAGFPEIKITLAGRLIRTLIELNSIYSDVQNSFTAGVIMLLLMVTAYFFYKNYMARTGGLWSYRVVFSEIMRIPVTALIMSVPLAFSLCWTFGITWLLFDTLNIMTSTLFLLLFGMGIDFGIHFYARYVEERGEGHEVLDAIDTTFMTTGQAITAVGITTSAAFFILMLADFKGFSEFGFIAGLGILFAIIAMIFVMAAFIILLERFGILKTASKSVQKKSQSNEIKSPNTTGKLILATTVLLISGGLTFLSIWYSGRISFEYDFGNLEPHYETYSALQREVRKVYSDKKTRNAAYVITSSPDDAVQVRAVLSERIDSDTLSPTIRSVETLQDRFPFTKAEQQKKLDRIAGIREQLNDPFIRTDRSDQLEMLREAASTDTPVQLKEVPGFLLDPFTANDGTIGNLVIIYPSVGLSDGRNSMEFADDLSEIRIPNGQVYTAASTSIVASDMLRLMLEEAPVMVALTLTFIIFIKLVIFQSFKWMGLALLPLVVSFLWLFGLMEITAWKINFYNIVVLPTILGIGDDSGIHMIHRYIEEGKGSIYKVVRSTGEHITVSAFTTMLGFAGLLFSSHPGMRSIGELAVAGIGLMLFNSLILLPSLLYVIEHWRTRPGI